MQNHGRLWPRSPRGLCAAFWLATCLLPFSALRAAEPFTFEPATHGNGKLELRGTVPVVVVQGSADEMGEQLGVLLAGPLKDMAGNQTQLLRGFGMPAAPTVLFKLGQLMAGRFPPEHLAELRAMARHSGVGYEFLVFGNVIYDVSKIGGCSALLADRGHSATGEVLFGRNMDFPTFGFLDRCSVLMVYLPNEKHAFASVAFPGFVGSISGMNDAGLCVAQLEVNEAKDGSSRFDPTGTPLALCFRRVLEECTTVAEAEKLLGSIPRTSMCNMAICDRQETAVLEITNRSVVRRKAENGYCACTNHFRTDQLCVKDECRRYRTLAEAFERPKLDLPTMGQKLDQVNQGALTIQSMIFEPTPLRLHLAIGKGPVSAKPMEVIELKPLFERAAQ